MKVGGGGGSVNKLAGCVSTGTDLTNGIWEFEWQVNHFGAIHRAGV
jgi:hypothetical protein